MPVEFRCSSCGKLLRTDDASVGRLARCPACGALTTVPSGDESAEASGDSPFAGTAGESPFVGDALPPTRYADEPINPYEAPPEDVASSPFAPIKPPAERVRIPAIGLIIVSSLGILMFGGFLVMVPIILLNVPQGPRANPAEIAMPMAFYVFGLALSILILVGSIKMLKLKSYGLAMTAAILAIIPCFYPCCFFGLVFGIWALIVLADANVRAAFG